MSSRHVATGWTDEIRLVGEVGFPNEVDLTDEGRAHSSDEGAPGVSARRSYLLIGLFLTVIDGLCLAAALLAAHAIRFGPGALGSDYLIGIIPASLMWIAVFRLSGLSSPQHLSGSEEARRTVAAVAIAIILVIQLTFWLDVYLSRSWMMLTGIIATALELTTRRIVRMYVARLQHNGTLASRTLIIGNGPQGAEAMETLRARGSGFLPVGYIDAHQWPVTSGEWVERLRSIIRQRGAECVFVAHPAIGVDETLAVTEAARRERAEVRVYTHLSGVLSSRLTVQPIGNGMSLVLRPIRLSPAQSFMKRAFDLTLALIGLVVTFPLLGAVALAIKLTSSGPVLDRQERVTEGGRTFSMYKFRTMRADADRILAEHELDPAIPFFKLKNDPRLTRVGKILRKLSLDELPQLFNVLRGDLSLVGPRPLPAEQVSANLELLGPRHEVRAGVTGWWQIQGRSDVDANEALRMDHFYIENWSLTLDLYILFRTLGVLIGRKGAY